MKLVFLIALVLLSGCSTEGKLLLSSSEASQQPIVAAGVGNSDAKFAASAASGEPARPPGYRNAWDDCGGVGASATERMRAIAAGIKGWAKPLPFVRNAAQDCGSTDSAGTKPGPGTMAVYPGPEITRAADDGLAKAGTTLDKYGPTEPPPPRQSIYAAASALQK